VGRIASINWTGAPEADRVLRLLTSSTAEGSRVASVAQSWRMIADVLWENAYTEEQLTHEPDVKTRNRKPVRAPPAFQAEWELRFGPNNRFRVFYQIDHETREVRIVAIGVKDRNRLLVGGEEVTL
jgi:hypothetical protein